MHAVQDVPAAVIHQVESEHPQPQSEGDAGKEVMLFVDLENRRVRLGSLDLEVGVGFDRLRQPQGAVQ